jgi:hypothetical protein
MPILVAMAAEATIGHNHVMRLFALVALAGCAGAEAHTALPAPPPPTKAAVALAPADIGLHPGETMTYEIHFGGMTAGEAQLAVGEVGTVDGHRAVIVKSRAATAGAVDLVKHVVDESTTSIDLDSGRPTTVDSLVEMNSKHTTAHAVFGPKKVDVQYVRDGEPPHTFAVGTRGLDVLDMHAAMAQVRGWRGTPGAMRTVYVIGGKRLWRIDLTYIGDSTIASVLGNRRAVQFDGASFAVRGNLSLESANATRSFSVWLSDDADRVPLKLTAKTELGDISMDLTEYQRP